MILKDWMIRNLEKYGNCAIGEKIIKQHGKSKIIDEVKALGYPNAKITSNTIIETNAAAAEPEIKKRSKQMFKINDEVKIIKGLHKDAQGTIVNLSTNDVGALTYEIYVEALFDKIGNISKKEGDLELMKRRAGRPKKIKPSTTRQRKSTDDQPESIDNQPESIDKPSQELVELSKEIVEAEYQGEPTPIEEPKSTYDQLIEAYDVMRRSLNVAELEAFHDIVAKDVSDAKCVLEQMYQMSIENLMKIRKELHD